MYANVRYHVVYCPQEGRYKLRKETKEERYLAYADPDAPQGYVKAVALRKLQEAIRTHQRIAAGATR